MDDIETFSTHVKNDSWNRSGIAKNYQSQRPSVFTLYTQVSSAYQLLPLQIILFQKGE